MPHRSYVSSDELDRYLKKISKAFKIDYYVDQIVYEQQELGDSSSRPPLLPGSEPDMPPNTSYMGESTSDAKSTTSIHSIPLCYYFHGYTLWIMYHLQVRVRVHHNLEVFGCRISFPPVCFIIVDPTYLG